VRWLVQLTASHLSRKVVNAVFAHLTQTLEHKGTLFSPVSLDYVKALEAIYSHSEHRTALDPKDWEGLIRTAFAAVYDEDIEHGGVTGRFTSGEAEGEDWTIIAGSSGSSSRTPAPTAKGKGRATDDMEIDEIESDSDGESQLVSTIQKVRHSSSRGRSMPAQLTIAGL
jgi:hypothetical protein